MWANPVIGLGIDKVPLAGGEIVVGISLAIAGAVLKNCLAARTITVCALEVNGSSQVDVFVGRVYSGSRVVGVVIIQPQAAVAYLVVPFVGGLVVPATTIEAVTLLHARVIGNAIKQDGIRLIRRDSDVPHGKAQIVGCVRCPAKVPGIRPIMEGAVGNIVLRIGARKG